MARYGLVVRGGRVVDPGRNLDEVADVAFADGKVAAVGAGRWRATPSSTRAAASSCRA